MLTSLRKTLSPNLRGILVTILIFMSTGSYMPFVNLAYDQRGLTEQEIGMVGALPGILVVLVTPLVSRVADRKRIRVILTGLGFLAAGVLIGLQMVPLGFWWILVLQLLIALFSGWLSPLFSAVCARMAKKYAIDYGNWRLWGSFAFAVSAFLMGMVWQRVGIEWLFLGTFLFYMVAGLANFLMEEPDPEPEPDPVSGSSSATGKPEFSSRSWLPRDIVVWLFLVAAFFSNMGMGTFNQFSAIYMMRLGGTATLAGLMRTASALVEVPTMYFASKLSRKIGELGVFSLSVGIFAIAWFLFSVATEPWMLIAITAFRGLGFGFAAVSAVTYLDSKARASEAASYQGLYTSLVFGVAPLLAGPLFGSLAQQVGLPLTFRYSSYVGALGLACLVLVYGIQIRRRRN
jgi:PPP family 3-phenylpropionic acid transporter